MQQNIIVQYLVWHFFDMPKKIVLAWKSFLLFNLNYFSVGMLSRTLFYPWRKYKWDYGKDINIKRFFKVLFSNLISRILGAIIRLLVIVVGLFVEAVILVLGLVVLVSWLIYPAILIYGFIFGLKRLIL